MICSYSLFEKVRKHTSGQIIKEEEVLSGEEYYFPHESKAKWKRVGNDLYDFGQNRAEAFGLYQRDFFKEVVVNHNKVRIA